MTLIMDWVNTYYVCNADQNFAVVRGSAHVLLNLLNEFRKRD